MRLTELRAGPADSTEPEPEELEVFAEARRPIDQYERNAYLLSEGKRLYSYFNCVGCHANGGGGMGPPLMDDEWIYGHRLEQIFASIVQGRPEGMPSFQGRLTDHQAWQLAGYVRSLGGLVDSDAAPGRPDAMKGPPPEHTLERQDP